MHHQSSSRACAIVLAAACLPGPALSQTTPPVPIYQDRDEPGRNPYQEYQFGCSGSSCTLTFKKVPVGRRRVVTSIACDQFVPSGGSPFSAALQSSNFSALFIPILYTYAAPYNGGAGYLYIANHPILAYFSANETPYVSLIGGGTPLANAHCNLSGYDIKS